MTKHIRGHSLADRRRPDTIPTVDLPSLPLRLPPLVLHVPQLLLPPPTRAKLSVLHNQYPLVTLGTSCQLSLLVIHGLTYKLCAKEESTSSGAWHMEYFVLVVLAPLTVVCLCCVIMFYYRRSSRLASHSSSLPTSSYSITSDNPPVPVNQSPLIASHRFSAQHQQERLRKQREMVCSHSESTEKFPTSVCLPDEDEPQHMRDNIRIHREVMSENGIRAPPNRTVYDSERQDLMIQCRSKTENLQRHSVRRSASNASQSSQSKRGGSGGGSSRAGIVGGGGGGVKHGATTVTTLQGGVNKDAIDSETRSPLNLVDSDSEGPPPYSSLVKTNNNIINVCDDSRVSTSSSTDGLLQSQQQQPNSPSCQPNSNSRFHASARGTNRGSGVRLKHEGGPDCV